VNVVGELQRKRTHSRSFLAAARLSCMHLRLFYVIKIYLLTYLPVFSCVVTLMTEVTGCPR